MPSIRFLESNAPLPNRRGGIQMGPFINDDRFSLGRLDFLIFFLCHLFNYNLVVILTIFYFRNRFSDRFDDRFLDGNLLSLLGKLVDRE
jgi:hypothetical protein